MSRRQSVIPRALVAHRTVTEVEGLDTTPPSNANADWDSAEGYPIARIYAAITFTGGTNPSIDLGVYVRHRDDAATPVLHVARAPAPDSRWETGTLRITGDDNIAFDVLCEGDDFLVLVEAVNGSPTNWSVVLRQSLR